MCKKYILTGFVSLSIIILAGYKPEKSKVLNARTSKPNIILIMGDDMGYSDIGCYGSEIKTPNLDQLAKGGLRYTQFYNSARCCPSRASLLTGLYPHQAGIGWMTGRDESLTGYKGELNTQCITIAELLKTAGYETYMTGKWHVASKTALDKKYNWPLQRGFDNFYGIISGTSNYYDPSTLCRDNQLISPYTDPEYSPKEYYFTDAISDNSVQYLKKRDKEKPFFMYVAYTAAHWPMQAPANEIQKYKGKYDKGWEAIRRERFKKMKALGVIAPDAELSPFEGGSWADEKEKPSMARRMETYAAMVDVMDQGIGRIIQQLKEEGSFEHTIILFLQDNGACSEIVGGTATKPLAADAATLKAPGRTEIQYKNNPPLTRDGKIVMTGRNVMAGPADTYLSYLKEWANVSNTPFRLYKHWVHEGGISTPLIVHWANGIKSNNELRTQPGHLIDLLPTLGELAGASYPKTFKGNSITAVAGQSLVPTFNHKAFTRKAIFWEHEMNRAVRMGRWKLVATGDLSDGKYTVSDVMKPSPPKHGRWKYYSVNNWELYDMEKDRSELHDLALQQPAIVKQMAAMWQQYALSTHVFPAPWTLISK